MSSYYISYLICNYLRRRGLNPALKKSTKIIVVVIGHSHLSRKRGGRRRDGGRRRGREGENQRGDDQRGGDRERGGRKGGGGG